MMFAEPSLPNEGDCEGRGANIERVQQNAENGNGDLTVVLLHFVDDMLTQRVILCVWNQCAQDFFVLCGSDCVIVCK